MPTFSWVPSYSSSGSREPKVNSVAFEDYVQESPQGVNNLPLKFELQFRTLDRTELKDIDDFLKERAGWQAFDWTPPPPHDAAALKFKCKRWGWSYDGYQWHTLSMTFEQDFQS